MSIGEALSFRVFVIDPLPLLGGRAGLLYLDKAVRQAAQAVYDLFIVERVKTKVEADVSCRMARELHDGIIQSLCCINMELAEVSRRGRSAFDNNGDPLARVQEGIEKGIAELREFTEQLRALEIDSSQLIGYLAGLTMKFQLQYGITTRFVSEVEQVQLPPRVCVELARITQEALVNIRKHSHATEVLVRFGRRSADWVLSVIDNGRGFGFSGRFSHEQLQASGKGPAVIMGRAHGISGSVNIESVENQGSILEIVLPGEVNF